jgi:two-component system sensor histidine kinase RegB
MRRVVDKESDGGPTQVRLHTLVAIRWIAICGQAASLLVVAAAFHLSGWVWLPLAAVAVLVVFNVALTVAGGRAISPAAAAGHLAFDLLQLAILLYLTGGLENPFALFLLAPVTVAAATLSLRRTALLAVATVAIYTLLSIRHMPLPWPDNDIRLPQLYMAGTWTALTLSTVFAALYTWRMAEEARRRAAALSATQIALAHEQKLTAVGAMATAVAHEMSTPLGTIHLVAQDMAAELPESTPLGKDIRLLISQVERCRTILTQLGQQRDAERDVTIDRVPLGSLVELTAGYHRTKAVDKEMVFDAQPLPGGVNSPVPWAAQRPEILHGLGNLLQNALQFASHRVDVKTRWSPKVVTITVADDGPGFPAHILDQVGEPYLSSRAGDDGHMGLGIFIADTLLGRTGARLTFANRPEGGAAATVEWPRSAFGSAPGEQSALDSSGSSRL